MEKRMQERFLYKELKAIFRHRVRSTGFRGYATSPFIVSFHILSNIIGKYPVASKYYSAIIDKAIDGILINTVEGIQEFRNVDYMFVDSNHICVAVMANGCDLSLCTKPDSDGIIRLVALNSVNNLKVSTESMKSFFVGHYDEFPYLRRLSKIVDSMFTRSEINWNISLVAGCLKVNPWIEQNLIDILDEIDSLISQSHFFLEP